MEILPLSHGICILRCHGTSHPSDIGRQYIHIHHNLIPDYITSFKHGHAVASLFQHIIMGRYGIRLVKVNGFSSHFNVHYPVSTGHTGEIPLVIRLNAGLNRCVDGVGQTGNLKETARSPQDNSWTPSPAHP